MSFKYSKGFGCGRGHSRGPPITYDRKGRHPTLSHTTDPTTHTKYGAVNSNVNPSQRQKMHQPYAGITQFTANKLVPATRRALGSRATYKQRKRQPHHHRAVIKGPGLLRIMETKLNLNSLMNTGAGICLVPSRQEDLKHIEDDLNLTAANDTRINTYKKRLITWDIGLVAITHGFSSWRTSHN